MVLVLAQGCARHERVVLEAGAASAGELLEATRIRRYPAWFLRLGLWYADVPGTLPVVDAVSLYRIAYWTRAPGGALVRASALVVTPSQPPRIVVGYLHGARTDRAFAPSAPSVEGLLVAAAFGGGGYLLVAPDYQGYGAFIGPHPFLHAEAAAHTVIDALLAARRLAERLAVVWPEALFLVGASQGGHAALATHRALEAHPVPGLALRGTATVGGPYDLAGIAFPHALEGPANSHAVYLAYLVDVYARIYGQPRSTVLRAPYAAEVEVLFDGSHDNDAVDERLPDAPRELFDPAFLAAHDAGDRTWLHDALAANSVHDWVPVTPMRLYYGAADRDVAPREAVETARRMSAAGADVTAIDLGMLDHDDAGLAAVAPIRAWLDALSQ